MKNRNQNPIWRKKKNKWARFFYHCTPWYLQLLPDSGNPQFFMYFQVGHWLAHSNIWIFFWLNLNLVCWHACMICIIMMTGEIPIQLQFFMIHDSLKMLQFWSRKSNTMLPPLYYAIVSPDVTFIFLAKVFHLATLRPYTWKIWEIVVTCTCNQLANNYYLTDIPAALLMLL